MKYMVISGGQEYGPADLPTLREWVRQGRIVANSDLKDELGQIHKAFTVIPELSGPSMMPPTNGPYANQMPGYQSPYTNYPRPNMVGTGGSAQYTWSIVCSVVGFLCCPVVFSVLGIVLGSIARREGHPNGKTAVNLGIISLIVGMILGFVVNVLIRPMFFNS